MNVLLDYFIHAYPLIVIIFSIISMNQLDANKAIVSGRWLFFSWINIPLCFIGFAMLLVGLDSFISTMTTEQAKDIREYSMVYFLAYVVLISLRGFKGVYPSKTDNKFKNENAASGADASSTRPF